MEFYKDYVDICMSTKAIWNEFSCLYTTNYLKFAEINIDKVPKLCERFNIDSKSFSNQLPTLILFEEGEEIIRYPNISVNNSRIFR